MTYLRYVDSDYLLDTLETNQGTASIHVPVLASFAPCTTGEGCTNQSGSGKSTKGRLLGPLTI